jgi:hypothetical protein
MIKTCDITSNRVRSLQARRIDGLPHVTGAKIEVFQSCLQIVWCIWHGITLKKREAENEIWPIQLSASIPGRAANYPNGSPTDPDERH